MLLQSYLNVKPLRSYFVSNFSDRIAKNERRNLFSINRRSWRNFGATKSTLHGHVIEHIHFSGDCKTVEFPKNACHDETIRSKHQPSAVTSPS